MQSTNTVDMLKPFGADGIINTKKAGNLNLARGAFGEISLGLYRDRNQESNNTKCPLQFIAIKQLFQAYKPAKPSVLETEVSREIIALRTLNPHPNIVTLKAVYDTQIDTFSGKTLALAFEYCPIDLQLVLDWRRKNFLPLLSFSVIKAITHDLFTALSHCHAHNILHRDVKPGNLLVSPTPDGFAIKLCDFGLTTLVGEQVVVKITNQVVSSTNEIYTKTDTDTKGLCTLYYRPPEVLLDGPADHPAVDVYSAGCVLAQLVNGNASGPLFAGTSVLDQLAQIFDALGTPAYAKAMQLPGYSKLNILPKPAKEWSEILPRAVESPHIVDLLNGVMALDPDSRPSAQEVVHHEWLSTVSSTYQTNEKTSRSELIKELVPQSLHPPPLLLSPPLPTNTDCKTNASSKDVDYTVAMRQALLIVQKRRALLSIE